MKKPPLPLRRILLLRSIILHRRTLPSPSGSLQVVINTTVALQTGYLIRSSKSVSSQLNEWYNYEEQKIMVSKQQTNAGECQCKERHYGFMPCYAIDVDLM
jgi:hypothetical protein